MLPSVLDELMTARPEWSGTASRAAARPTPPSSPGSPGERGEDVDHRRVVARQCGHRDAAVGDHAGEHDRRVEQHTVITGRRMKSSETFITAPASTAPMRRPGRPRSPPPRRPGRAGRRPWRRRRPRAALAHRLPGRRFCLPSTTTRIPGSMPRTTASGPAEASTSTFALRRPALVADDEHGVGARALHECGLRQHDRALDGARAQPAR